MTILLLFLVLAIATTMIWKLRSFGIPGISRKALLMAFALKLIAGFALWWTYTYVYPQGGDMHAFMESAAQLDDIRFEDPEAYVRILTGVGGDRPEYRQRYFCEMPSWDRQHGLKALSGNRMIIRLNALIMPLSGGDARLHIVIMSLLSFLGLLWVYRAVYPWFEHAPQWLFWGLVLTPSVMFWSSGVLKEALLLAELGLLCLSIRKLTATTQLLRYRIQWLICATLALLLLWGTRVFIIPMMVPGVILGYWVYRSHGGRWLGKAAVFVIAMPALLLLADFILPVDLAQVLYDKRDLFYADAAFRHPGSLLPSYHHHEGWPGIFLNIPMAIWDTLIRPIGPAMLHSPMKLAQGLENILLWSLVGLALYRRRRFPSHALIILLLPALLNLVLIGLTTPVLGAIVRFRITALVFLVPALLLVIDTPLLNRKLSRLAKQMPRITLPSYLIAASIPLGLTTLMTALPTAMASSSAVKLDIAHFSPGSLQHHDGKWIITGRYVNARMQVLGSGMVAYTEEGSLGWQTPPQPINGSVWLRDYLGADYLPGALLVAGAVRDTATYFEYTGSGDAMPRKQVRLEQRLPETIVVDAMEVQGTNVHSLVSRVFPYDEASSQLLLWVQGIERCGNFRRQAWLMRKSLDSEYENITLFDGKVPTDMDQNSHTILAARAIIPGMPTAGASWVAYLDSTDQLLREQTFTGSSVGNVPLVLVTSSNQIWLSTDSTSAPHITAHPRFLLLNNELEVVQQLVISDIIGQATAMVQDSTGRIWVAGSGRSLETGKRHGWIRTWMPGEREASASMGFDTIGGAMIDLKQAMSSSGIQLRALMERQNGDTSLVVLDLLPTGHWKARRLPPPQPVLNRNSVGQFRKN